jgi:hypothetical protein
MIRSIAAALFASFLLAFGSVTAIAQKGGKAAIYLTEKEIEEIRKGSACKSFVRQIVELKKQMAAAGISDDYFDLRVIPTDELVKGKKGTYYAVYLRDAKRKRRFQFSGGRYVIKRFDTRFRAALASFTRKVLAPLHGGLDYALYVRGSASSRPMRRERKMDEKFAFEKVDFMHAAGEEFYDANRSSSKTFADRYGNEELPYLRAAFLQKVVGDTIPFARPKMLESIVSDSRSRKEQFAEILLFVDWQ